MPCISHDLIFNSVFIVCEMWLDRCERCLLLVGSHPIFLHCSDLPQFWFLDWFLQLPGAMPFSKSSTDFVSVRETVLCVCCLFISALLLWFVVAPESCCTRFANASGLPMSILVNGFPSSFASLDRVK